MIENDPFSLKEFDILKDLIYDFLLAYRDQRYSNLKKNYHAADKVSQLTKQFKH